MKLSKCTFAQTTVEYLGHVVTKEGVHVDQKKIEAVLAWPVPINIKQLRGFLGLIRYYRKFVARYSQITFPLTGLLKKNKFSWNSEAQGQKMTHTLVLALPNFSKMFVVETDASGSGIGAVLSQEGHPLAYFSKKMPLRLRVASSYVRELYAITQSIHKWRHYLLGRKFTVKTDHRSLKKLIG